MSLEGKTVLVVDDDEDMLSIIAKLLKNLNCEKVLRADNGDDANTIIKTVFSSGEKIHIIVCDYKMPKMTGLEFYKKIQMNGFLIPFIIVTAAGDFETVTTLAENGITSILVKPIDSEKFSQRIEQALKQWT